MFTINDRNSLYDFVMQLARDDSRVVAGALVGSLALDEGDHWSDLDLTFSVEDELSITDVLEDWTQVIQNKLHAAHLFDVQRHVMAFRVFLLPSCLQCDMSFTPSTQFGPMGPRFKLLFGDYVEKEILPRPPASELFGYVVHHVLRARICIERKRSWQAEFWASSARDYALHLACLQLGLPTDHGRGFDNLPSEWLGMFKDSLVSTFTRKDLTRALACLVKGLLRGTEETQELAIKVKLQLLE